MKLTLFVLLFCFAVDVSATTNVADADTAKLSQVLSRGSDLLPVNMDSALIFFNEALPIADKIISESNYSEKVIRDVIFRKAKTLDKIANYYYGQKYDYDKTLDYLLPAIDLLQGLVDEEENEEQKTTYLKTLTNSMITAGAVYFNKDEFPNSLEYYNRSLENATLLKDSLMQSRALLNLGMVFNNRGMFAEAIQNYYTAMGIFEHFNDKKGVAICNLSIGNIMRKQNSLEKAIESYGKALEVFAELKDQRGLSSCYNNLAICYSNLNDYDKAIELYNKSLDLDLELGREANIAITYANIAVLYQSKKEFDTAIDYVRKSMQLNAKNRTSRSLMVSYLNLSGTYLSKVKDSPDRLRIHPGDLDTIIVYGEKGRALADSLELILEEEAALDILKDGYALKKNYRKAFELADELNVLRDSIFNSEKTKVMAEAEAKYETEKKEQQISQQKYALEHQQAELQNARRFRNLLAVIAILMVVVVFLVYYHYSRSKKAHKILDEKSSLIEKQNRKITQQNDQLEVANQKLTELLRFKEKLTGMIVHDLKNPLNNILNSHNIDDPEFREQLIMQSGFDMLNLTQNILDVYRFEESQMSISKESCSVLEILKEKAMEVALYVTEKNLMLEFPEDKLQLVNADGKLLRRIFSNLLGNAVKYAPSNSTITVTQRMEDDKVVRLGVHNLGPAIPREQQENIFKRFRQYESRDMGVNTSTGLGLSFCKMAVEIHGGEIGVHSDENGTEFWFTLPNK
ncbi:tetratricopeptide repeat-containing sensor histidine kinase [Maribellus sp. YY47]|uniref:tetratricopeptide repeat-containing sensor histidine kinase n=1 Tax=Maribellus sp. YY47 TaxID=2929486 RepID=UPI0020013AAB|nr:tetratricopeptide repeat-containing sensor histidine kinase [Maribellus sp. YY47]MCK3685833.1 tetratricopeptide repeat-containing sensor histidine kinase [Maribellus sp. YY47]